MNQKPHVGDIVRLTDEAFGRLARTRDAARRADRLIVTWVGENLTEPEPTWPIQVDQKDINAFLIHSHDIELVERPAHPSAPPPEHDYDTPPLTLDEAVALGVATITHDGRGPVITIG